MNTIQIIKAQINAAKTRTDKLMATVDTELWLNSPAPLNTNMNWQIGHIFLANYLHGIASISGPSEAIRERIDIKDCIKFYGMKSDPTASMQEKPTSSSLVELYKFSFELIFEGIDQLTAAELESPTAIPNPAANTKYEALTWLSQHQFWHNGQIAMLSRILNS